MIVAFLLEATDGSMKVIKKENVPIILRWIKLRSKLSTMRHVIDSDLGCEIIDYYYSESVVLEGKRVKAVHIIGSEKGD